MSATTVGPAKAALKALWTSAVTGLADQPIQVTYGRRVTVAGPDRVTIGGALGNTVPQSLGPARQMRENYDIRCAVSVTRNGTVDDQQLVTERCLLVYATIEQAVRILPSQNLSLTGVIDVLATVEGDWELGESEASDTNGPINTWYEFNVHIQARFRLP